MAFIGVPNSHGISPQSKAMPNALQHRPSKVFASKSIQSMSDEPTTHRVVSDALNGQ